MFSNLTLIYFILSLILLILSSIMIKHGLNLTNNIINKSKEEILKINNKSDIYILVGSMSFGVFGGMISNILAFDAMKK